LASVRGGDIRFDLRAVLTMRRRQDDGLHLRIGYRLLERCADRKFLLGGEIDHRFRLQRNAAHEIDRRAEIARRFHKILAPPAEADNRGIEHPA